jgi:hypothetical protein
MKIKGGETELPIFKSSLFLYSQGHHDCEQSISTSLNLGLAKKHCSGQATLESYIFATKGVQLGIAGVITVRPSWLYRTMEILLIIAFPSAKISNNRSSDFLRPSIINVILGN